MMLIGVLYHLLMIIGDSILSEGFELGYEVLNFLLSDETFAGCRSDGDFILFYSHECLVDLGGMHVELLS